MIHGSSALQVPALSDQDTQTWITSLSNTFSATEVEVIKQACQLASLAYDGHKERTELPLMQHATATAAILVSLHLDAEAIAALFCMPHLAISTIGKKHLKPVLATIFATWLRG